MSLLIHPTLLQSGRSLAILQLQHNLIAVQNRTYCELLNLDGSKPKTAITKQTKATPRNGNFNGGRNGGGDAA